MQIEGDDFFGRNSLPRAPELTTIDGKTTIGIYDKKICCFGGVLLGLLSGGRHDLRPSFRMGS